MQGILAHGLVSENESARDGWLDNNILPAQEIKGSLFSSSHLYSRFPTLGSTLSLLPLFELAELFSAELIDLTNLVDYYAVLGWFSFLLD